MPRVNMAFSDQRLELGDNPLNIEFVSVNEVD